jgi:hypothetical protein
MPYFITDKSPDCEGWATIKEDGEVIGCHTSKQKAIDQMVAVSIAEDMEPGGERAMPDALEVGDYVSWNSSGGRARGEIQEIFRSGRVQVPGTDFVLQATEDDPVALIQIYRPVEGGWEDTDTIVGHKFSTLTKIAELPEPEDEPDDEDDDDMDEERELPENYRLAISPDVPANRNCGNCGHFKRFYCDRWDASVSPAYYCNAWIKIEGSPNANPGQEIQTGDVNDEEPYYNTPFIQEFDRQVSLDLPQYIRSAARKGLDYYGKGLGGDGLVARTIREAREMARGSISEDKVIRANAWGARHLVDLQAPQNSDAGNERFPGKGAVAFYLWGINPLNPQPAMQWYERKAEQIKKAREERFNPSQPRDENGKWTSGSGANGPIAADVAKAQRLNAREMSEKIAAEQKEYVDSLSMGTRANIEGYTVSEYYDVNKVLRNPNKEFSPLAVASKEAAIEKGRNINEAINNSPSLSEDATFFRGVNPPGRKFMGVNIAGSEEEVTSQMNSLVGTEFTDKGIVSVSASVGVAENFSGYYPGTPHGSKPGMTFEVRVPAGKKALYVSDIGVNHEEQEFLLPSNTKFRVVSVDPAKFRVVTEVIS